MKLPLLRVTTRHSSYLIDQNEGTAARTRGEHGTDMAELDLNAGKAHKYRAVSLMGNRLAIDYADGRWSVSSTVQSIEEVDENGNVLGPAELPSFFGSTRQAV